MSAATAQRKLTAILAADVVGYSRLIAAQEEATLDALSSLRNDRIDPLIDKYRGRIANTAGDSLLLEFPSVVEALRCAIEIQKSMAEWNGDVALERRVEFRIGINLGDIVERDGDLFGDGVNVAARLESIAEPGGILLSAAAFDQVRGRIDTDFVDLGQRELKNIPLPVQVYAVDLDGKGIVSAPPKRRRAGRRILLAAAALTIAAGVVLWWIGPWTGTPESRTPVATTATTDDKPSIAVLPFDNISDDKEQEYFSDGITDDLITDLSKISGLLVIARNSTLPYKGKSPDVRQLAEKLGVRYVLEGSVRRAGRQMRINAQLIDGRTGTHLWAERYDGDYQDVFALQDKVTGAIVSSLAVRLTPDEERRVAKALTNDPKAYDLYLKGLRAQSYFTKESNAASQRLFLQAIERDHEFAAAYANLAQTYSLAIENLWTEAPTELKDKALAAAKEAIRFDDELPFAYWSLGRIYTRAFVSRPDLAVPAFEKAVALNPNYADGYMFLALTLIFTGKAEESTGLIEKAMRLNPDYPFWYVQGFGMSQFFQGDYEAAAETFRKAIERNPAVPWLHHLLIATYGKLGMRDDAEWEISELEALGQPATINKLMEVSFLYDPAYRKIFEDGLRKAGMRAE